ncbi:MAG: DinB family protein [Chloroflexota bacterium]|nr:DinB family protein [Chloroflexota bacterium]
MDEASAPDVGVDEASLVDSLAAFLDELERAIAGRPVETLVRPASDGGWGVIENLCHLRDWEEVFLARARALVEQDRPSLPAYDDELWAIERDYRGQDPMRVVQRFRALRADLVALLRGADPVAWSRVGVHEVHGEVTLRWLAEQAYRHGDEHLGQIREALA